MAGVQEENTKTELRLLLAGKTGVGKSAVGNSLLGYEAFPISSGPQSKTASTQCCEVIADDSRLVVVDTPGFYDTVRGNDLIIRELIKVFAFLSPGFHSLLYVMTPERFTEECCKTKDLYFRTFGEAVARYTIIVVTHQDNLQTEDTTVTQYVAEAGKDLQSFVHACGNRVVAFNNKAQGEEMARQVDTLLHHVRHIVRSNANRCFTNKHFKAISLYNRVGRTFGKTHLRKARGALYRKIAQRFGVEGKYTWRPEEARLRRPKSPELLLATDDVDVGPELAEKQLVALLDIEETGDVLPAAGEMLQDRANLRKASYLDRLIHFFLSLFTPLHISLFGAAEK